MQYAPLVKYVVSRVTAKLPLNAMDREEMVSVGIIGLMSALENSLKQAKGRKAA